MGSVRVIGRYVLCDAIAAGGAATVHTARLIGPERFSRTVAIKRLHAQFARNPEFVAMFLDEARLASRIHHPNVVSPQDIVVIDDEILIVMEYVHGESLSRIAKTLDGRRVPVAIATSVIGQVLLGLQAAHEAASEQGEPLELVHRDVSPQNILLGADGVTRLIDFGVAKARNKVHQTDSGMVKGKPGYMAPEQVMAGRVDRRTDVFAAGIVLWEMLTGQKLFRGENANAAVQNILHKEIVAPSTFAPEVPAGLDEAVLVALARDPADRFQNARAMAMAVASVVQPAGALELGAWTTNLCGAVLQARAERLHELEAVAVEELTLDLPRPTFTRSRAPGSQLPGRAESSSPKSDAAVSSDGQPSSRVPSPHRRGALWMSAAAALLALSALCTTFLTRRAETSEPSLTALPFEANPSKRSAPASLAAEPPGNVLAPQPRVIELGAPVEKTTARAPKPAPLPRPQRATAPASSARKNGPRKAEKECDLPFLFDSRGVKRFNAECF